MWNENLSVWGKEKHERFYGKISDSTNRSIEFSQNLRFQGQYLDEETGLHYNNLRFFDPAIARFISEDPIGLNGGENLFFYAPNPNTWIDPLGLTGERFPSWMNTTQGYQRQHLIPYSLRNHPAFVSSGMNINGASNMMYLPVARNIDPRPDIGLHKGWTRQHLEYNDATEGVLDELYERSKNEKWDYRRMQRSILDLQHERRKGFISGRYTCA